MYRPSHSETTSMSEISASNRSTTRLAVIALTVAALSMLGTVGNFLFALWKETRLGITNRSIACEADVSFSDRIG